MKYLPIILFAIIGMLGYLAATQAFELYDLKAELAQCEKKPIQITEETLPELREEWHIDDSGKFYKVFPPDSAKVYPSHKLFDF